MIRQFLHSDRGLHFLTARLLLRWNAGPNLVQCPLLDFRILASSPEANEVWLEFLSMTENLIDGVIRLSGNL